MTTITFDEMRDKLKNYYHPTNFPILDEYVIKFNRKDFRVLLRALCAHYIHHLEGRKRTKKGFNIDYTILNIEKMKNNFS